ncbi:MAG: HIT family protein [Candidatus Pacebacteria bacterium]|nr:HIT family protein [Candidatus Paceibacterota bacterium]PIR60611.1 MAG: diadenosine tetraphosphate hydrolase [Candidatus Pacebacteria bacterium CG10_big_fil_rev_8_21_14_0_10_44_54]
MASNYCVFCQISTGDIPIHQVWEDQQHLGFLSIFPNTEGFTVVIPKQHLGSDPFAQTDDDLQALILATKKVANILTNFFSDVSRCGMFFEGFGVDHLHSKLYPMHGTGDLKSWKPIESGPIDTYFEMYPGYLSSHDSHRAPDEKLAKLATSIRASYQNE